jgi:hypothetical protein
MGLPLPQLVLRLASPRLSLPSSLGRALANCRGSLLPLTSTDSHSVDARYGPFSTINLIRKLGELTFLAHIFFQNNINSTCPMENSAMQEFEQKWRENTPLNPSQKPQLECVVQPPHGSKGPPEHATDLGQRQCTHTYMWDPLTSHPAKG